MSRVLLGVTGGIAAYKACELCRLLVKEGHEVVPLVTPGAERFVTAETFRRALRSLPRYEPRGVPFRAWLCRICINLINDELGRRQNALRFSSPMPTDAPPDAAPDEIAQAETRAMVHALIDQLPPDHREVIMLRFADDLSVADVAVRLGRSPAAVKQLQRRALAGLRSLATEGGTDA